MIFLIVLICVLFILMDRNLIYEQYVHKKDSKVIGYDFDDCLQRVDDRTPIEVVVKRMLSDLSLGHKVVIVTSRGAIGLPEIHRFLQKYGIDDKVEVYHTGNNSSRKKSPVIKKLNVSRFYDDQPGYLDDIRINAPHVELYQTDPNRSPVILPY